MKTQFYTHATASLFLVLAVLAGCTAAASPELTGHVGKEHPATRRSHHKAQPAVKHSRVGKLAATGLYRKFLHSSAAGASPGNFTPDQWQDDSEMMRRESSSGDSVKQGDADAQLHNWSRAAASYQDALNLWPDNSEALYGLGQCAAASGDLSRAISYYHTAIYVPIPNTLNVYGTVPGGGFQTNDVKRLMEFAVLLNKVGQVSEALFIYNRAAALMDYERGDVRHGEQNVKVLLPGLALESTSSNLVQYTSDRLQALADTALARQGFDYKAERVHIQEAVKLYPDSAVVQYYLGEALAHSYYHTLEHPAQDKVAMIAAYKKTIELGDDQAVAAAKERLSMFP